ncbi:ATP-dependent DNA helicase RecG [Georgenia sp. Z1344]|uniref:ATP-dependent DNA helicase RecG n=1 Tax=Georgenia sp. Z1344 TaxID=3416706 RepID=UPI003CEF9BB4
MTGVAAHRAGEDPAGLDSPVSRLVRKAAADKFARLGVRTQRDLLRHYPFRWVAPGRLSSLADLRPGEQVTVVAEVVGAETRVSRAGGRGGSRLVVTITDGSAFLTLVFFGSSPRSFGMHTRRLRAGVRGQFTGEVSVFRDELQLTHPDYQTFEAGEDGAEAEALAAEEALRPTPIYPATRGLPSWVIAATVRSVLDPLRPGDLPEPLPAGYRAEHGLLGSLEALRAIHHPADEREVAAGALTLRHEEAFLVQTALARRRAEAAGDGAEPNAAIDAGLLAAFDAALPFTLTRGQSEVGAAIAEELSGTVPMQRLLHGEVGSGKTVVAARAMLQVVDAGGQAALLAPTEVLAQQHHRALSALLGPLARAGRLDAPDGPATRVGLLTGSQPAATRRDELARLASGETGIVVGTHALLTDTVQIPFLRLVVVDEQHKFGVEQRDALRMRGEAVPHQLIMTATPIPRTVAMTVFGDLETSVLGELPAGRSPIATTLVPAANARWMARVWERVREEVDAGGRAYVVVPRIDAGDSDDAPAQGATGGAPDDAPRPLPSASVEETSALLAAEQALAGVRVGVLHGRMAADEKDAAMAAFASGETPVLVATTVVEVGVDVSEASIIVVLDADRFGLSQLHQLRGRVGRGSRPSICLVVSGVEPGTPAWERLEVFASTSDGFALAEADLSMRREGDVLGTAQSGRTSGLRLLRLARDADVIAAARTAARELVSGDPDLERHPGLADAIAIELADGEDEFLDKS